MRIKSLFLIWLALTFILLAYVATMRAESVIMQSNTFGAVIDYHNPNTYLYGAIVSGNVVGTTKVFTDVVVQPSHVFLLYTTHLLLCGDQMAALNIHGPIVITYQTRSRERFNGFSCHTLVAVDRVPTKTFYE